MNDPLTFVISTKLPEVPFVTDHIHGILGALSCAEWLKDQKNIIGWTYSCNPMALELYNVKKLIVGVGYNWLPSNVRYASNSHTKCYIGDDAMLIGSFNLTAPTISDVCILVERKSLIAHMKRQFALHWKTLK